MNFVKHLELGDRHAFLSASKPHWLRYDAEHLAMVYRNARAAEYGTKLHELAAMNIEAGRKLEPIGDTLSLYVNDAISYGLVPEQKLKYSENCFGTADGIQFDTDILRIHDLKTGVTPTKMEQLEVYAALFCLEYSVDPRVIDIVLRIYQNDEFRELVPDEDEIIAIMNKIVDSDRIIESIKGEVWK